MGSKSFVDGEQFHKWSHATDFFKLHTLDIGIIQQPIILSLFTEQVIFSPLKHLSVCLGCRIQTQLNRAAMEAFFESLPPLNSLTLEGTMDTASIQKISSWHGHSLQDLRLYPGESPEHSFSKLIKMVFTPGDIRMILQACPGLQRLDLTVTRSKGDTRETACYEALTQSKSLKYVNLRLDCVHYPRGPDEMDDDSLDDFDRAPYHSHEGGQVLYRVHARDAILNFAIDETFAWSAWAIIRLSRRDLISLGITPEGPRGISTLLACAIMDIGRDLRIEGNHFDDQVVVSDTSDMRSRMGFKGVLRANSVSWEEAVMNLQILRRIWPCSSGQDWRQSWKSLPLQRSS